MPQRDLEKESNDLETQKAALKKKLEQTQAQTKGHKVNRNAWAA